MSYSEIKRRVQYNFSVEGSGPTDYAGDRSIPVEVHVTGAEVIVIVGRHAGGVQRLAQTYLTPEQLENLYETVRGLDLT